MPTVKTAISIQESLFQQVDEVARQLEISRSKLFVTAVEAYLQRYENQELLKAINSAYDDLPDQAELEHAMLCVDDIVTSWRERGDQPR